MAFILVCDTHCGVKGGSSIYHDVNVRLFQHLRDTAIKRNIDTVIHLGDWFHDQKTLTLPTLHTSIKAIELLGEFHTYILLGNHDLFYKYQAVPTSLEIFGKYPNVSIVDTPTFIKDGSYSIGMVPWVTESLPDKSLDLLLGHFDVTGFGIPKKFRFQLGDFQDRYEQVFSGHFHFPMELSNVRYLGAPYHMEFGESGDHRGYYIFDNGKLEFIEFSEYPRYKKIVACEEELKEEDFKGNYVKLVFERDYGTNTNARIIELAQSFKPIQLYPDFSNMLNDEERIEGHKEITTLEIRTGKDLLFDYIEKRSLPDHLKLNMLKRVVESLLPYVKEI